MNIEKVILDYFVKIPHIISITLFGSFARKAENAQSDVDIAVFWEQGHVPDGLLLISRREELSVLLHKDVDLVCLNTASPIIGMQVYKNGKLLKVNDTREYAGYQIRLFVDYAELKELRAPMEKNILKRKYYDRS
jgi:predicted nucleotidyltransferase